MNKKKLIIFTSNKNKIKEIKKILPSKFFKIYSLRNLKKINMPIENGRDFINNAIKKSSYGFKVYKIPCIADDSGISINALNGKPGVKSNRFQKKLGGYNRAFKEIIKITKRKKSKTAYFTSVVSFTHSKKSVAFKGVIKGTIVDRPQGKNGFGYDPIFRPNNKIKTYGQMSLKEKNKISHRTLALKKLIKYLKKNSFY